MSFLSNYGLFFAKTFTLVIAILVLITAILVLSRKGKDKSGKLEIKKINDKYEEFTDDLTSEILTKAEYKKLAKQKKQAEKNRERSEKNHVRKRIFLLNFFGDIKASPIHSLREEISAILLIATPEDEVVLCLESGGGLVANYGLAASQLQRLKQKQIPLTVIIDKIAASGGYMMACVGQKVLAAPFAIIGSIGVIAQLPNFHRFLKKREIDFEQLTAGQYKRTLTLFGENTEKARQKMQEEVEEIHNYFKTFIQQHRPQVDLSQIATGEHWLALRALELQLIDGLSTSDDYLLTASEKQDIYSIQFTTKKSLGEKLSSAFTSLWFRSGWTSL